MNLKTYSVIVTIVVIMLSVILTGMVVQILDLRAVHSAMVRIECSK